MKTFSDFGITVSGQGHARTTCPQCSPSRRKQNEQCLSVDIEAGLFYCHHCGWSGSINNGKTSEEIEVHFRKPEYKPSGLPQNVIEWFLRRGIPEKILTANQIGYGKSFKDKNGIQFPYIKNGEVVNIKHRSQDKDFRQEKDAEKCLYRFDEIAKGGDCLIITEGEIDALSIHTAGYDRVTSIPDGAPSAESKEYRTKFDFLKSAEKIIESYPKVILATDNDAPGRLAERELARRIGIERCYRVEYPDGCKDANDVLKNHGAQKLINVISAAKPFPVEGLFSFNDLSDEILTLYDQGEIKGVSTGWKSIDNIYTVRLGELTIITGIPGSGKSEWLDQLLMNLHERHGWRFALCSPENWPPAIHAQKLLEKALGKPFGRSYNNFPRMYRDQVEDGAKVLGDSFFFIMPQEDLLTVDTILEKARIAIRRYGISGLVIDPWNEVEHIIEHGQREDMYISQQLTRIRRFARLNGIHVWIVAHPRNLRKNPDTGLYEPPTMYEISGGAQWRNKADNGICVHRPNYEVDETLICVQKIRFKGVGRIGDSKLKYCRATGNYSE